MRLRRVIQRRIQADEAGLSLDSDINVVLSVNVDKQHVRPGGTEDSGDPGDKTRSTGSVGKEQPRGGGRDE
jgi:hypothetical protein